MASLTLCLETGEITKESGELRRFQIEVERPPTNVNLRLGSLAGQLPVHEWPKLVEQVKAGELAKRHFQNTLEPPLGRKDVLAVVTKIDSTPSYQLFLAGIDIAEMIDLATPSPTEIVKKRLALLDKWMPSITGAGGLFLVPDPVLQEYQDHATQELVKCNKLCVAILAEVKRFYIPYATPIGFLSPVGKDAKTLWEEIRSMYYAFRYSA